jgi:hypothetical protein
MVYSIQNAAFRRDKHQFFSQLSLGSDLSTQIQLVDKRAQAIDYSFLLKNQNALELEFSELFHLLQKQDTTNKEAFWLYCYYSASLLEHFHRAYGQEGKEAEYIKIKGQIKKYLQQEKTEKETEKDFIQSIYQSFLTSYRALLNAPFHLSQIRDNVVYANICRIYWIFCRLTLTQGLTLAKNLQLIDKLDLLLGTHTNVDKIIATIQAPTGFINYFSVGFFLMRFTIDAGLLIKHSFFPSDLEKGAEHGCEVNKMQRLPGAARMEIYRNTYILIEYDKSSPNLYYVPKEGKPLYLSPNQGSLKELKQLLAGKKSLRLSAEQLAKVITQPTGHKPEETTSFERFKHELYKRHCNFANDLVWATVNFLTKYNSISGISGPIAGYLTSVFLVFDISMTLYKCHLAKEEYLTKKAQYWEELAEYNDPVLHKGLSAEQKLSHSALLNQQLLELEFNWKTKEATFYFATAAATLLMFGFTASLILTNPLLITASFFACTVAVAMYLSTGIYAQYQEKALRLEHSSLTGAHRPAALIECEMARNDFIFAMTKNTFVPLMLITTVAIYWPAAVVLAAVYGGAELLHAQAQHTGSKAAKAAPEYEDSSAAYGC